MSRESEDTPVVDLATLQLAGVLLTVCMLYLATRQARTSNEQLTLNRIRAATDEVHQSYSQRISTLTADVESLRMRNTALEADYALLKTQAQRCEEQLASQYRRRASDRSTGDG